MATKPKIKTLTNTSVDVLNAIRNNASNNYRDYVPVATADAESIREIGAIIMDYPALQNEFLSALVNRIGRVILSSKLYTNPWAMFKRGMLDFGETIEEIFTNIAKPFQFDPEVAEEKVFKREIPDVRSAFHTMNYQKFYKATVSQEQLRQAFMSMDGVTSLIASIVDAMYTGAAYDEFETMKYMLARNILRGRLYAQKTDSAPLTNPKNVIADAKSLSNKLTFLSNKYNPAGVYTHTLRDDQFVIVNSDFEATMSVDVLASAFNMDKTEFMGHVILVDGFGDIDNDRLDILFADDKTYTKLTSAELEALASIPLVVVDRDYFMIYDNLYNFTENYNGEGLYWNYFYHTWKTFSISPFANAIVFVPTAVGITSVTVTPDAVSIADDFVGSIPLSVAVVTTGFASEEVDWTIKTDLSSYTNLKVDVTKGGVVQIAHTGTVASYPASITVRATSVVDSTKYDDCVITLVSGT